MLRLAKQGDEGGRSAMSPFCARGRPAEGVTSNRVEAKCQGIKAIWNVKCREETVQVEPPRRRRRSSALGCGGAEPNRQKPRLLQKAGLPTGRDSACVPLRGPVRSRRGLRPYAVTLALRASRPSGEGRCLSCPERQLVQPPVGHYSQYCQEGDALGGAAGRRTDRRATVSDGLRWLTPWRVASVRPAPVLAARLAWVAGNSSCSSTRCRLASGRSRRMSGPSSSTQRLAAYRLAGLPRRRRVLLQRLDDRRLSVRSERWKLGASSGSSRRAPDRFVDGAQVGLGEALGHEGGGERGVLELSADALDGVLDDLRVVERDRPASVEDLVHADPSGRLGVGARVELGEGRGTAGSPGRRR